MAGENVLHYTASDVTAEALLDEGMEYIGKFIRRVYPGSDHHIIGPAPASVGKINDVYRRIIYLKHKDGRLLAAIRDKIEKYIEINTGFRKMYIQFDFE